MSQYQNAHEILKQVRYDLNEYSDDYLQATDTTGSFKNESLMSKINAAQRIVWNILFMAIPEAFLKSATLSFASSIASLPSDFYRIRKVETSDGVPVNPISVQEKHIYGDGSEYLYYRYGDKLRIDTDSVTRSDTLWYYFRPRTLDQGQSSAGSALSLTLASSAFPIADYYNSMQIENVTDSWVDTISDYSATRVCTLAAQTGAASKYYGLISDLPEPFHHLIAPRAAIICRQLPQAIRQTKTEADMERQDFGQMLSETLRGYAGTNFTDVSIDDIFNDFG